MAERMTAEMLATEMMVSGTRTEVKAPREACHASSFARPFRSFCIAQEAEWAEMTALGVFLLDDP
jgi:hypothetical protein